MVPLLQVPDKISILSHQPGAPSITGPLRLPVRMSPRVAGRAARPPTKHAQVQTDKDLVVLLACQLFCNEIAEAITKEKAEPRPLIRNEIFADVPLEEIPAILRQAKAIVDRIVWKAKYGANLLGTVSASHFTAPTLQSEVFVESHKYASP